MSESEAKRNDNICKQERQRYSRQLVPLPQLKCQSLKAIALRPGGKRLKEALGHLYLHRELWVLEMRCCDLRWNLMR